MKCFKSYSINIFDRFSLKRLFPYTLNHSVLIKSNKKRFSSNNHYNSHNGHEVEHEQGHGQGHGHENGHENGHEHHEITGEVDLHKVYVPIDEKVI